jgi:hypothetical protein
MATETVTATKTATVMITTLMPMPMQCQQQCIDNSDNRDMPKMCIAAKDGTIALAFPCPLVPVPCEPEAHWD